MRPAPARPCLAAHSACVEQPLHLGDVVDVRVDVAKRQPRRSSHAERAALPSFARDGDDSAATEATAPHLIRGSKRNITAKPVFSQREQDTDGA